MRAHLWKSLAIAVALAAGAAPAHAQPVDVPALQKLIENQPAGEDRSAWKEKRREAARKLGQSKDKRAVPILIKLAETETFDIIGDIAIEGLGNLGDPSAVPVLTKISNDATRDKATREIAKKALAKLPSGGTTPPAGGGTPPTGGGSQDGTPPAGGGTEPDGGGTEPDGGAIGGSTVGGSEPAGGGAIFGGGASPTTDEIPAGPDLPEDLLAATDRLTFAAGTAALSYDTIRKRPAFDADVAGRYEKRIERESMAWGFDLGAHVVGGFVNPELSPQNRGLQINVDGGGEARFYKNQFYGVGKAAVGLQLNYVSIKNDDPDETIKDTRTYADLQIALGVGYGRVIDVGSGIRVRQLARMLDANRALGKQIDATTARRLQMAWWGLRGERSMYRALVATVAILREAGILLGEPDAGLTYEILTVLRDNQLSLRPSGLDVQVAFGEGYLLRPEINDMDPQTPNVNQHGRVESLLISAGYGKQIADDKAEVSGTAFGRMRLFADSENPDGAIAQPAPWAFGATGRLRRFAYGDHGDAFGVLDLSGTVIASSDGCTGMDCEATRGLRIAGEVGFTLFMNQASGIRLAGNVAQDSGELFIGGTLTATYGLLDGSFAASGL
ncbi:MAG: HEAT repeat domain-containing protein [Kofleriaceae bacterium]